MKQLKTYSRIVSAGLLVAAALVQLVSVTPVAAAQITNRSLTLQSGALDGGSLPGGVVNHDFKFDITNGSSVGSIKFQYCTTAAAVPGGIDCNTPVGMSSVAASIGNQLGETGFVNITNSTNGTVIISRAAAANVTTPSVEYRLDGITNPDDPAHPTGMTFFVRISTYSSLDASGTALDTGTVAAATNYAIDLEGTMPESLVFCTGATVDVNAGNVPDCATATAGDISFDRLFSPTDTAVATSQMAASTNAGFGYNITVNGPTLTSGSNTITGMNSPTTSIQGTPQFGLNLVANTTTADVPFGAAVTQTGGALYTGTATTDYNTAETFKYLDGDSVAKSTGGSDAQIYTVAYMANVSGSQPAGTYATTLTYVCTPKF